MKKLLIAAAIASTLASGAQATTYAVSSDITGHALWLGFGNTGSVANQDLAIAGTADDTNDDGVIDSSDVNFTGQVQFNAAGVEVRVTFNLQDGNFVDGTGITYSAGNILVETDGGVPGDPFTLFDLIDLDDDAADIPFIATTGGGAAVPGPQNTAGVQLPNIAALVGLEPAPTPGSANVTEALGGLWDGAFGGTNFNNGAAAVTLLGNTAGMYLSGDIIVAPVPVPAAAWLFGSALVGLAGIGRKKRRN